MVVHICHKLQQNLKKTDNDAVDIRVVELEVWSWRVT